jgi:hypothetical protein
MRLAVELPAERGADAAAVSDETSAGASGRTEDAVSDRLDAAISAAWRRLNDP